MESGMEQKKKVDELKEFWESKNKTTKNTIIFSSIAVVVLVFSLIWLYTKDSYEFLLSTADKTASANVLNQLKEQNIKYNVDGESIYVSGVDTDALKLELIGNGYLDTSGTDLELFSKPLFVSEKQEDTLRRKDLESNIASAIKSYSEVTDAKVILTDGKESSFKNDIVPATAAIQVKLKSSLNAKQVKSIQEFVAADVPNLSASDVVITDTSNNLLSDSGNVSIEDNTQYTKAVEDKISSQLTDLLSSAFPTTGFKVVTRAEVNFDESKIEKETVSSGPDTIVSHETHSEVTSNKVGGSVAGSETNVPSYETDKNNGQSITEKKSEIINYELNKTTEQITKQPELVRMNVAVIADKSLSAVDTEKIRDLVETASGYNEKRGDKVSVQGFDAESETVKGNSFTSFIANNFDSISSKLLILIIVIAIIVFLFKIISLIMAPKEPVIETIEDSAQQPVENVEGVDDIILTPPVSAEKKKKKEILKKEFEENPEQVASVLKIWKDKSR